MWRLAALTLFALGDPRAPVVRESRPGDAYVIDGAFSVVAPPEVIWNVLTDYANFPSFISSMTKSKVVSRQGKTVVLDQEAVAKLGPFSRTLHLRLETREVPRHAITFRDVLGRDFVRQDGSWSVTAQAPGYTVTYHLVAQPRQSVPNFIEGSVFKETAIHLLTEVRDEIDKRAARAGAGAPP